MRRATTPPSSSRPITPSRGQLLDSADEKWLRENKKVLHNERLQRPDSRHDVKEPGAHHKAATAASRRHDDIPVPPHKHQPHLFLQQQQDRGKALHKEGGLEPNVNGGRRVLLHKEAVRYASPTSSVTSNSSYTSSFSDSSSGSTSSVDLEMVGHNDERRHSSRHSPHHAANKRHGRVAAVAPSATAAYQSPRTRDQRSPLMWTVDMRQPSHVTAPWAPSVPHERATVSPQRSSRRSTPVSRSHVLFEAPVHRQEPPQPQPRPQKTPQNTSDVVGAASIVELASVLRELLVQQKQAMTHPPSAVARPGSPRAEVITAAVDPKGQTKSRRTQPNLAKPSPTPEPNHSNNGFVTYVVASGGAAAPSLSVEPNSAASAESHTPKLKNVVTTPLSPRSLPPTVPATKLERQLVSNPARAEAKQLPSPAPQQPGVDLGDVMVTRGRDGTMLATVPLERLENLIVFLRSQHNCNVRHRTVLRPQTISPTPETRGDGGSPKLRNEAAPIAPRGDGDVEDRIVAAPSFATGRPSAGSVVLQQGPRVSFLVPPTTRAPTPTRPATPTRVPTPTRPAAEADDVGFGPTYLSRTTSLASVAAMPPTTAPSIFTLPVTSGGEQPEPTTPRRLNSPLNRPSSPSRTQMTPISPAGDKEVKRIVTPTGRASVGRLRSSNSVSAGRTAAPQAAAAPLRSAGGEPRRSDSLSPRRPPPPRTRP